MDIISVNLGQFKDENPQCQNVKKVQKENCSLSSREYDMIKERRLLFKKMANGKAKLLLIEV